MYSMTFLFEETLTTFHICLKRIITKEQSQSVSSGLLVNLDAYWNTVQPECLLGYNVTLMSIGLHKYITQRSISLLECKY